MPPSVRNSCSPSWGRRWRYLALSVMSNLEVQGEVQSVLINPPSMTKSEPVTFPARSLASRRTRSATFPAFHTNGRHPAEVHLLARRRKAGPGPAMCPGAAPPGRDDVALGDDVVDLKHDVGKRVAIGGVKRFESGRPLQL